MRNIVAFAWMALAAPAFSATHQVPADEPIATIQLPEEWQTKELGEGIEAISADGLVRLLVVPAEGTKISESMLEAMRYIKGKSGIKVKAESEKQERGKVNGMDTRNLSWEGRNEKGEVKISFTVVLVAEKKPLLMAYWGSPQATKKHERELKRMLQSIKQA